VELVLTLEEVSKGVKRTLEIRRQGACSDCGGKGSRSGAKPSSCPTCRGHGQVDSSQGFFTIRRACPHCGGEGTVISDPCPNCRGEGRRPVRKEVEVEVPPGVQGGMQLRLRGEGDCGTRGGPSGDLYCTILERRHEIFERDGSDLILTLPISFADAALGAKIEVPTLKGRARVSIPAGTQSGEVLRLRGQGLPSLDGGPSGNLLVRVVVETPRKLTGKLEEALHALKRAESEASQPERSSFFERIKKYFKGSPEGGSPPAS
jgi:molecular chaperone DnaJ